MPPDRMAALMALQNLFGQSPGGASPATSPMGAMPQAAEMGPPGGGPGLPSAGPPGGGGGGMVPGAGPYNVSGPSTTPPNPMDPNNPDGEMDLFQRVTQLIMDPSTRQVNPIMLLIFAGMGVKEALEKTGKYASKPHRANEELAAMGFDVGTAGQTGMPSPQQMARKIEGPQGGGMPGF